MSVAAVTLIRNTSSVLEVPLPPGLLAAIEQADQLVSAADKAIGDGGPQQMHDAVLEALRSGGDPGTDKAVARAINLHYAANHGALSAVRQAADDMLLAGLRDFTDELLTVWSIALQPHLAAMTAAAEALRGRELDDINAVNGQGAKALGHWQSATQAARLLNAATSAAATLAAIARIAIERDKRPVLYTTPSPAVFDQIRSTGKQVDPWSACQSGLPLTFVASLSELGDRLDEYDGQRRQAILDEEQRQRHPKRPSYLS